MDFCIFIILVTDVVKKLGQLSIALLISISLSAQDSSRCIIFPGMDSAMLNIQHSASLEMSNFGQMTVEFWVWPEQPFHDEQFLIKKSNDSWDVSLDSSLHVHFRVHGDQLTSLVTPLPLDTPAWNHIAAVYNGDSAFLYINGFLAISSPAGNMHNAANRDIHIGSGYHGKMDELRLWRTARKLNEIRFHMHHELPAPANANGLSCELRMNEDSSSICTDASAMGNEALLIKLDSVVNHPVSTAPIPYTSVRAGDFLTDSVWNPEQGPPLHQWSRVKLRHHLFLDSLKQVFGLQVDQDGEINIKVEGALTVHDTIVNDVGNLGIILRSDSTGTASLIHHNQDINAVILKYFSADTWHHFSTPTKSNLTGVFYGMWLLPYDEQSGGWGNYIGSAGMILEPMKGYAAWSSSASTGNHTIFMGNRMNQGSMVSEVLTRSNNDPYYDGFNFTGNPYPSGMDWEAQQGISRQNLDNAIYAYDAKKRTYSTLVNNISVNGGSRYLPPTQGFFVRVSEGSTQGRLSVDDGCRVHYQYQDHRQDTATFAYVKFIIRSDSTGYGDEIAICFDGSYEPSFTPEKDAFKLIGTSREVPQIWSLGGDSLDKPMAINNLGLFLQPSSIPLEIKPGHNTTFRIEISDRKKINANTELFLEDIQDSVSVNLNDTVYHFSADTSDDPSRFMLHIDPTGFAGRLQYGNDSLHPMPEGWVRSIGKDTAHLNTDKNGGFALPFADTGRYILQGFTNATWTEGAVNAVDALLILRHINGLVTMDSLAEGAADVNRDGHLDSTDARLVAQRFADINPIFTAPDWTIESKCIRLKFIDIEGIRLRGLQTGDVNASRRE